MFAGHRIERLLGSGGMGTVYLARHPSLPRLVALKLLDPALTSDPQGRDRFLREADHAARLDHPNIVTVFDRGAAGDPNHRTAGHQLWLSMQYVAGTDAAAPLRQGPMPAARAVRIVAETARALDYAHAHGVLHRDVKPANILLSAPVGSEGERVLLADFGIAKGVDAAALTRTGTVLGSLQFASPEQIQGLPLDPRSDQYSLGCTFFQLLTGQLPYPGFDPVHLLHAHLSLPVPRVSERRPDLPTALDGVIARSMAKDPGHRYPSCVAFADAASAALHAGSAPTAVAPALTTVLAPPTVAHTAFVPAMPTTAIPATPTPTPAPVQPVRRRSPRPLVVGGTLVAVVAAAATAWLIGSSGPDSPGAPAAVGISATAPAPTPAPVVAAAPSAAANTPESAPPRTHPPTTVPSAAAAAPPAKAAGKVKGTDAQGFVDEEDGPRCDDTDPAVAVARTPKSAVVVCETDKGRYYYRGVRRSDGADIELDDPRPTSTGFIASDDTATYTLDSKSLTIAQDGGVVAREPVLEYRFGGH
ncbi:serine/threonine-protein kinase [Rhodococcus sp. NPDC127528]|uniref:serine/threonine-protein kinase n=1 Tax=unclassified Rhodococcus (in: high G+C Gram-positive bacteria) TaxID=192944 RepID=UPI00362594E1